MVSCPPSGDPMAQGEPGSPGPAFRELFGPFLAVVPIG